MGQLKEDLVSRILDASSDGPNWNAVVEWMAEEFEEVIEACVYLYVKLWKDNADGVWLDRAGDIVGVKRPPNEEIYRVFRVRGAADPEFDDLHGFGDPTDPDVGGYLSGIWGVHADGLVDDEAYLDVINAKIAATNADASVPGIARYLEAAFGYDSTVTTDGRMVYATIDSPFNLRTRRYAELYSPAVAGVSFAITNWPEF